MAETEAAIGYGTWLKKGDGGSPTEVFTDLGIEITAISPPGWTREAPDATHMQSPDRTREFIEGLLDSGEVSVEGNLVTGDLAALDTALRAGRSNFQIGNADWDVRFDFSAIPTGLTPATPLDDKMTFTATFKVSGKPTLTAV